MRRRRLCIQLFVYCAVGGTVGAGGLKNISNSTSALGPMPKSISNWINRSTRCHSAAAGIVSDKSGLFAAHRAHRNDVQPIHLPLTSELLELRPTQIDRVVLFASPFWGWKARSGRRTGIKRESSLPLASRCDSIRVFFCN